MRSKYKLSPYTHHCHNILKTAYALSLDINKNKPDILTTQVSFFSKRSTTLRPFMLTSMLRVHDGYNFSTYHIKYPMLGLKAGALNFITRVLSPITIHIKNSTSLGQPIKGKKHQDMKQSNTKKTSKPKIKRKKR